MLRFSKKTKIITVSVTIGILALGVVLFPWVFSTYKLWRYDSLGDQSVEQGEWRIASFWYQKALEQSPNNPEILDKLTDNADYFNDPAAVDFWRKRSEIDPQNNRNTTGLLKALLRNNLFSEAKDLLYTIEQQEDPEFHQITSSYYLSIGDYRNAEKSIRKAVQLSKQNNEFQLNLLNILLRKGSQIQKEEVESLISELSMNVDRRADLLRVFIDYSINKGRDRETLPLLKDLVEEGSSTWIEQLEYLKLNILLNPQEIESILVTLSQGTIEPIFLEKAATTLLSNGLEDAALNWLNSNNDKSINQQLSFQIPYSDTLSKLEQWEDLISYLQDKNWSIFDYYRDALMALAHKSMGNEIQSTQWWRKAVRKSNEVVNEQLRLVQMVENWKGFEKERLSLLEEMLVYSAHGSWAYKKLHKYYRNNGDIWDLYKISQRGHKARPKDQDIEINRVFYSLLLNQDIEDNYISAQKFLSSDHEGNESVIITNALACIKMDKINDGIDLIENSIGKSSITPELAHYLVTLNKKAKKEIPNQLLDKATHALLLEGEKQL